jgi:hypothetical protein
VGDGDHREVLDSDEVFGIAGVKGEIVGYGDGGDHGVVGTCRWFPARSSQTCGDPTEAVGCGSVERQGIEVSLGLLEVRLPCRLFLVARCHQWTHREFGQGDGSDQRFGREWIGGVQSTENDERARVEDPATPRLAQCRSPD